MSAQGCKEITLLGQNVNSYAYEEEEETSTTTTTTTTTEQQQQLSRGFSTIYKQQQPSKTTTTFAQLVDQISLIDPEMRIRFTSPHPKDFPDGLLQLIRDRKNICKAIHLPAQSGSDTVLQRMRRGYTKQTYLDLVHLIRSTIPHVALSSDFISGFCEETDAEHAETLDLLNQVQYDHAFMFAYSLREKTHAHRTLQDNVPDAVKQLRLQQVIDTFRKHMLVKQQQLVHSEHVVLVDGSSRKNAQDLVGRTDCNRKVVLPSATASMHNVHPGDYVRVRMEQVVGQTMIGSVLRKCRLQD